MASTYSTNLAIELIGTGDQAGSWGNTTNTNLGTLIEQAISGYVTQAVSTGTDTTITIPNGATGVARNMYIELTGTGGTNTNLIVPANKKLYFIFNNSTGAVTVKVSGQTGVSVPTGKKMVLVSNGTDVVVAENYIADFGSNSATITNLTCTSLTLSNNPTFSGGTANGVLYLNGSKVATSGSALVFDGTNLGVGTADVYGALNVQRRSAAPNSTITLGDFVTASNSVGVYGRVTDPGVFTISTAGAPVRFSLDGGTAEGMRLTSTGLGIGTASPSQKLHVVGNALVTPSGGWTTGGVATQYFGDIYGSIKYDYNTTNFLISSYGSFSVATNGTSPTTRLTVDTSGNLGLGVTPSAWGGGYKAFQIGFTSRSLAQTGSGVGDLTLAFNAVYDATDSRWEYTTTGDKAGRYSQTGNGDHAWYTTGVNGTAGNAISFGDAKMTLDASGNLGVGTTSPSARLDVRSAIGTSVDSSQNINLIDTTSYALGNGGGVSFGYVYNSGGDVIGRASVIKGIKENATNGNYASALTFSTTANSASTTEKARITSGGDFLTAGKTSASFTTVGAELLANGQINTAAANLDNLNIYNTTAAAYRFYVTGAGTVFATNTTISAISDQRFKENVQDLDVGLNAVMALKPRKFDWKAGKGKDIKGDRGFIAQEFEQVFPDLIDEWKDPAPEGEEPYKAVRADLIPVLVKAIQEQQAMIETLKAKVSALEAK